MEKVDEVLGRFELRGRCLVEKGVRVDDPSICEGDPGRGLLVVGSRMQFFVDRWVRGVGARAGGMCAVAVGESSAWAPWVLGRLETGEPGLLEYNATGAVLLAPCGLGDLPRLAERAAEVGDYENIYDSCKAGWGGEEEDVVVKAEQGELEDCLRALRELEGELA
jgi:hypothetical protein